MPPAPSILDLEIEWRHATAAEAVAKQKREAAEMAYNEALLGAHPIQPGDIVSGSTGELAIVTQIRAAGGVVRLRLGLQKKDGSFGIKGPPYWQHIWDDPILHKKAGP